jgi:hypothetical protein
MAKPAEDIIMAEPVEDVAVVEAEPIEDIAMAEAESAERRLTRTPRPWQMPSPPTPGLRCWRWCAASWWQINIRLCWR